MRIDTEFDIGDEVYVVERANGNRAYGVVGPVNIDFIEIYVGINGVSRYYECKDLCGMFLPDQLFKTLELAIADAEALNK